ncbi:MAG: type 4a pilus biogenesis protein PilO [Sandaracinaceae bacterium]|nr:type 4a pilus biogenesis protein PilO [Sandaracinaceae bacterium]
MAPPGTMAPAAKAPLAFGTMPPAGKVVLLIIIVGILTAVYYFALHMPLEDEIASADGRTMQLRTQLDNAHARQEQYLALRQRLDQRAPLDRQNRRILPRSANVPAFLQDLNRLAGLSDLQIFIETRPEEATEQFVKIPVSLRITGRYHQIAKFFFNVSKLDRAISMENLQIKEPTAASDGVSLTVEVLATTYRQPDSDSAQPGTTAAAPVTAPAAAAPALPEDEPVQGPGGR